VGYLKAAKKQWARALLSMKCCWAVWKPLWRSHTIFELARLTKK